MLEQALAAKEPMMRKLAAVLALVFLVAFGFGALAPENAEAASGCFFTCSCAGEPLYCCPTASGGVACKSTTLFECPQVYNC